MGLLAKLGISSKDITGTDTDCWIWPKGKFVTGYGSWRSQYAHRVAYAWAHGEIPEGYAVHHKCGVRACFNPAHLEAMHPTDHQHLHHLNPPSCVNGHSYPENERWKTNGKGERRRDCAECHRLRERERNRPKKEALAKRRSRIRQDVASLESRGKTRSEIAKYLKVSKETVRRIQLGQLKWTVK